MRAKTKRASYAAFPEPSPPYCADASSSDSRTTLTPAMTTRRDIGWPDWELYPVSCRPYLSWASHRAGARSAGKRGQLQDAPRLPQVPALVRGRQRERAAQRYADPGVGRGRADLAPRQVESVGLPQPV